ncbi:MAG: hypothetical protein M1833_002609 [Piccolia ochrophora]|nr:MAG: hypothetical protein M1833_002609 [Piccolia ochrophora]
MVHSTALTSTAAALLLALSSPVSAMYSKGSPVLQLDGKSYDRLIAKSNHTSIVEFYAPWCGHCKNLKPGYEKAAKSLSGLAKVAAIDCDAEMNKPFCGSMGVQGFPTLKIVKPGKKPGRSIVEDYQGARTAKAIVEAVIDKIPNHVKRIQDKNLDEWLDSNSDAPKAILFSNKGTVSALLKSLAIDFLSGINFAQIRDKEKTAVEKFGITTFPSLIVLPGGDKEALVYEGEMKKEPMLEFLSKVSPANPDPPAKKPKESKAKKSTKSKPKPTEQSREKDKEEAKEAYEEAASSHASEEASEAAASATTIVLEDEIPTESPDPIAASDAPKPQPVPGVIPPIPTLESSLSVQESCLNPKSKTCILVFLPSNPDADVEFPEAISGAISILAEIAHKHAQRQGHLFPFYAIPSENEKAPGLRTILGLKGTGELEIVAVNARRNWWRRFEAGEYDLPTIEGWIDAIRLGEGEKKKLPQGLVEEEEVHDEL